MRILFAFLFSFVFVTSSFAEEGSHFNKFKKVLSHPVCKVSILALGTVAVSGTLYLTGNHEAAGSVAGNIAFSTVYAVLRARDSDSIFRPLTFLAGFPTSILPWALVTEGSHEIFGVRIKPED